MPTWKKILHEDSSITIDQITGLEDMQDGQVIIGSGDQVNNHDLTNLHILVGDGSNNAKIAGLVAAAGEAGGDIIVESVDNVSGVNADVKFHIIDEVVTENKIADDSVSPAKIKHQGGHGILVYDDNVSDGDGVPTFLAGGTAGQIVKVNGTANGFEFADAASSSTIDISLHDGTRRPVIFGGEADDDSDTGQVIRKDQPSFNYLADQTFASDLYKDAFNSTVNPATVSSSTADLHVDHIKTNITGTAGAAAKVYGTNETGQDVEFPMVFASNGDSGAFGGNGYASSMIDKAFTFNPADQMLTVPNLKVTGTNTIVNTANLHVDDKTIRVASSTGQTTTSDATDSGLVVNIGTNSGAADGGITEQNADTDLPRLIWANDPTSTKGWIIANKGTGSDTNLAASAGHGIAVLTHDTAVVSQATLNSSFDHGIGAFFLSDSDGNPELYIQVA